MQCTSPKNYNRNGVYLEHVPPCNKCLSCALNRQHQMAARLVLESMTHTSAQFITFTFDPAHLPSDQSPENLKHIWQLFIKKFRYTESQPRYYVCMEFGNKFQRPHFHAIFFGRKTSLVRRRAQRSDMKNIYVYVDPIIEDTWGLGSTYVKDCSSSGLTKSISNYVAGYILKGLWKPTGLNSQQTKSEWALQSRRPYIGYPAVKLLSEKYLSAKGCRRLSKLGTIPNYFYFDNRRYQLPPRIRKAVGYELGYPVLPLPQDEKTSLNEALAKSNKIARSIRKARNINVSPETA